MPCLFTCKDDGNLGLHVGDVPERVHANREALRKRLGLDALVFMDQMHGDSVVRVEDPSLQYTCDALISDRKGIALVVMVADCLPVLLYDPVNEAMGAVHAGRKGIHYGIVPKCVRAMQESFGTQSQALEVVIGPSIRSCCYRVGQECVSGFEPYVTEDKDGYTLDLLCATQDQLLDAGVRLDHIRVMDVCTCCSSACFSYRKERTTGRFGGLIWL